MDFYSACIKLEGQSIIVWYATETASHFRIHISWCTDPHIFIEGIKTGSIGIEHISFPNSECPGASSFLPVSAISSHICHTWPYISVRRMCERVINFDTLIFWPFFFQMPGLQEDMDAAHIFQFNLRNVADTNFSNKYTPHFIACRNILLINGMLILLNLCEYLVSSDNKSDMLCTYDTIGVLMAYQYIHGLFSFLSMRISRVSCQKGPICHA